MKTGTFLIPKRGPQTTLFSKNKTLFGIFFLSKTARQRGVACCNTGTASGFLTLRIPTYCAVFEHNRFQYDHPSKIDGILLFQEHGQEQVA